MYAAMVKSLDDAVGTLLDTLDNLKLADNTIVVFFSDNGGVNWYDDKMKPLGFDGAPPTSNAPLRGGKASLFEGGTREPCIVSWPGHVKPGTKTDALLFDRGLVSDAARSDRGEAGTRAALRRREPNARVARHRRAAIRPFASSPITANRKACPARGRKGDWKLLRFFDADDGTDRLELYDLKNDVGETKNLAIANPEKVRELAALLDAHLKDIHPLMPVKNPTFRASSSVGEWNAGKSTNSLSSTRS